MDNKSDFPTKIKGMEKQYYVYILTNKNNTILYTGVTGDLGKRIYEHKTTCGSIFCRRYNVTKLVYVEVFNNIEEAIYREKQIKAGNRKRKISLVKHLNPEWKDLYGMFVG